MDVRFTSKRTARCPLFPRKQQTSSGPLGRRWSIFHGDFEITPEAIGSWVKRNHAIGLAGDSIYDSHLRRDREGIEIHSSDYMESARCALVEPSVFEELGQAIIAMIDWAGSAF